MMRGGVLLTRKEKFLARGLPLLVLLVVGLLGTWLWDVTRTRRAISARNYFVVVGTFLFQGILTMTPSVINSVLQTDMSEVIRIIVSNGMILYALTRKVRVKR